MTEEEVQSFAASISSEPFGLAYYRPDPNAENCFCFGNVWKRVASDGGRSVYGWTFQIKIRPEGEYLVATHHAVWCNPQGQLVDVTPVHQLEIHRPLMIDGDILFQVDSSSEPISKGNMVFPLPLKYHTLSTNEDLVAYVNKLQSDEIATCEQLYSSKEPPPNSKPI